MTICCDDTMLRGSACDCPLVSSFLTFAAGSLIVSSKLYSCWREVIVQLQHRGSLNAKFLDASSTSCERIDPSAVCSASTALAGLLMIMSNDEQSLVPMPRSTSRQKRRIGYSPTSVVTYQNLLSSVCTECRTRLLGVECGFGAPHTNFYSLLGQTNTELASQPENSCSA